MLAQITTKNLQSLLHICQVMQTLRHFTRQILTVRRINKTPTLLSRTFSLEIVKVGIYESGGYETRKWRKAGYNKKHRHLAQSFCDVQAHQIMNYLWLDLSYPHFGIFSF